MKDQSENEALADWTRRSDSLIKVQGPRTDFAK